MELTTEKNLTCLNKGPYYNHFVHLISFGTIWIIASFIGYAHYENIAIIFLFAGISLFHSLYNSVRRMMSLCPISSDDPLKLIISCITLSVPLGITLGFLPFLENINMFFSAFGILFGLVFMVVAFVYRLISYAFLSTTLIVGEAIIIGVYDNFSLGGFFAGCTLIIFGITVRIYGALSKHDLNLVFGQSKKLAA